LAAFHVGGRLQASHGLPAGVEVFLGLALQERVQHLARRHVRGVRPKDNEFFLAPGWVTQEQYDGERE
jgi:hypothetical protein